MSEPIAALTTALADRYRVERKLGEGGMATVYLAEDLKHQRKVALKVLRPELAAILGAERFLHEIRTTANLQHPHILPLHDSGQVESTVFYVMPFVEGESLRDRLDREKQLPIEDAVRIASQVAGALDYAHRHGVIHRDIKPENILLHDGSALVADFGIALAASSTGGTRMTETGMSLGTPHYMSPEQAMGEREITARSDVYALGVVAYEMLTGDPPFTGSTAQAIVARVVTEDPRSITLQRKTVPPHVEEAVLTALSKLPADRYATAAEFAAALAGQGTGLRRPATTAVRTDGSGVARWRRVALVCGAVALAAVALAGWLGLRPRPEPPVHRFGLALPDGQRPQTAAFSLSRDAGVLVYQGPAESTGGEPRVWVKLRDRADAYPLAGTEGAGGHAVSPDGRVVAYTQRDQLRKAPTAGGPSVLLADSAEDVGAAWLDDGTLVYSDLEYRLRRVPASGGKSEVVYTPPAGNYAAIPTPLPGSRGVLFLFCRGQGCQAGAALWVLDLRNGEAHEVVADGLTGFYLPTGHVVAARPDGALLAAPFDLDQLVVTGEPVPVLEGLTVFGGIWAPYFVTEGGTLVFRQGAARLAESELVWVDRGGRVEPVDTMLRFRHADVGGNRGFSLSPDGRRVAIGRGRAPGDAIWIKALPDGPLSRLTFDSTVQQRPRWSPDGRSVLYLTARYGNAYDLYQRPADGTGSEQPLIRGIPGLLDAAWTPDGKALVVRIGGQTGVERSLFLFRPGVDTAPRPLVADAQWDEAAPAVSPDGRWLAYESNETGRKEVYVRPFPGTDGGKWQVSTAGGHAPRWARNGRELFYVNLARELMAVPVPAAPPFAASGQRPLFRLDPELLLPADENYALYDVAADGRFLFSRRVPEPEQGSMIVVAENWFSELREKLRR